MNLEMPYKKLDESNVGVILTKMFVLATVSVFAVCIGPISGRQVDFPPNFPRCSRDLPKPVLDKCMLEATETVKPMIANGVRKLGFVPLKPSLHLPEIKLDQDGAGADFSVGLKDLDMFGLDEYKFTKLDFDFENHFTNAELELPYLFLKGLYVFKGTFFGAQLDGKGLFTANITTPTLATLSIKSKIENKDGVVYLNHYDYKLSLKIGEVTDHNLQGLFDDNEILAKAAKKTVEDNLGEFISTLQPAITKVITSLLKDVYFKKLNDIPYDLLFPPKN